MAEDGINTISSIDMFHPLPCETNGTIFPEFLFEAPIGLRVRFEFQQFSFDGPEEYLEIGEGLVSGEETRSAHFSGTDVPSDVTSVSNSAWIRIETPCRKRTPDFSIMISAVNNTGIFPQCCSMTIYRTQF